MDDLMNQTNYNVKNLDSKKIEKNINSIYNKSLKRSLDLFLAIILLILLSPVFLIISLLIIVDDGFPVFYKAERGGYQGSTFRIFKFRSMIKNAENLGGGTTALNDVRITKIGHFLRKTKLDEIPQLINIIKGDMSFIGPRPELLRYTSHYKGLEKNILNVRPGITDFSSIAFINLDEVVGQENADEMYEKYVLQKKNYLRIKYVEQISFSVDCNLFFKTVIRTISKALKIIFKKEVKNGKNFT